MVRGNWHVLSSAVSHANAALISHFYYPICPVIGLSPCLTPFFSKFPVLIGLLSRMCLSSQDALRSLLSRKASSSWKINSCKARTGKICRFTGRRHLHVSKGTWASLILVTSGAQRQGGKVVTWAGSNSGQTSRARVTWGQHDILAFEAKQPYYERWPGGRPQLCLWVACHKVSGSLEL